MEQLEVGDKVYVEAKSTLSRRVISMNVFEVIKVTPKQAAIKFFHGEAHIKRQPSALGFYRGIGTNMTFRLFDKDAADRRAVLILKQMLERAAEAFDPQAAAESGDGRAIFELLEKYARK